MGMMDRIVKFAGCLRGPGWAALCCAMVWAGTAKADYRDSIAVLRIGMVETHVASTDPVKLDAIQLAFSKALGIPVEIIKLGSYAALIDAHASGRVGYAIHSARSFAATQAACGCVRAFRIPVAADGSTGFRSVLVARASVTVPVAELKVGYSDETSVSGWQIPHQAITAGSLEMPTLVRGGSVGSVIELYQAGAIDGFFGWLPDIPGDVGSGLERLFGGWNRTALESAEPLRIIWSSQRVPYGPHATNRSLPDDLVEALGAYLDGMATSTPGLLDIFEPTYGGGYVIPDQDEFQNIRGLVEAMPDRQSAVRLP